jgi:hypothetical protein
LSENGYRVIAVSRNLSKVSNLVSDNVEVYQMDITCPDQIKTFFDTQNAAAIVKIQESISKIRSTATALGRNLSDQENMRIDAYLLMIDYYNKLATEEQLRNFRLSTARDLLKQMNDTLSIQQKLLDLGLSGGIFDIFTEMVDNYKTEGLGFLIQQVEVDLDALDELLGDDGFFDPDNLDMSETAIRNSMSSLTELIDSVSASYATQKKIVEDRYKSEIEAIKKSHSDRWSTIDYTNKLGEAEDKILEARRKLMGLAISGVSRGTLEQSQKELKKLQEERQKIIEQQMVEEATKQMETDMDRELIATQQQLTAVLNTLIVEMNTLRNAFLRIEEGSPPTITPTTTTTTTTGGSGATGAIANQIGFDDITRESIDKVTISNNKLHDKNITLVDSNGEVITSMSALDISNQGLFDTNSSLITSMDALPFSNNELISKNTALLNSIDGLSLTMPTANTTLVNTNKSLSDTNTTLIGSVDRLSVVLQNMNITTGGTSNSRSGNTIGTDTTSTRGMSIV